MIKIDSGNNIVVTKGDTGIIDLKLENHTLKEKDKVTFSVKLQKYDKNYLINKRFEKINENTLKLHLTEIETDLVPGIYNYDIECRLASGLVDTIFLGKFKVIGDVTNENVTIEGSILTKLSELEKKLDTKVDKTEIENIAYIKKPQKKQSLTKKINTKNNILDDISIADKIEEIEEMIDLKADANDLDLENALFINKVKGVKQ